MEKDMHELKEMLMGELHSIVSKGELSAGSLDAIDKITHSIKSITTILAMNDAGYSSGYHTRGYSRDESVVNELHDLMKRTSDNKCRMVIQRAIEQLEG